MRALVAIIALSLGHATALANEHDPEFRTRAPLDETPPVVGLLRLEFGVQGALGGQVRTNFPEDEPGTATLQPGVGVYVRGDVRLHRFLLFRPTVRWRSVRASGVSARLDHYALSMGLGVSRRFDFRAGPSPELELLAGFDVGIGTADGDLVFDAPTRFDHTKLTPINEFGLHAALRAGVIVWTHHRIGIALSAAYERNEYFPNKPSGGRGRATFQRAVVELGAVVRLSAQ